MLRHSHADLVNFGNQRYAPRYEIRFPVQTSVGDVDCKGYIRSVSLTGMSIEASTRLNVGDKIEVILPGSAPVAATIIWSDGMTGGCSFDRPLSKSVLSSVRLKGYPIGADAHTGDNLGSAMTLTDWADRWPGIARFSSLITASVASWALVAVVVSLVV